MTKVRDTFSDIDMAILEGSQIYGPRIREFLAGKYEVVPKTLEHIKVQPERCNGCKLCVLLCPAGCYEMEGGKAVWKYGQLCVECGACQYICSQVNAIDWSYPEGGTGIVMRNT
ncbi:MAG: 4Fe-4S dicluster domain-containing protein [Coriobacteriia bacterium]